MHCILICLIICLTVLVQFERISSAECGCNAFLTQKMPDNVTDLVESPVPIYQLDDVLLDEYDLLKYRGARHFDRDTLKLWPNNRVKFRFSPKYPYHSRNAVRRKIYDFQRKIDHCVRFSESNKYDDNDYKRKDDDDDNNNNKKDKDDDDDNNKRDKDDDDDDDNVKTNVLEIHNGKICAARIGYVRNSYMIIGHEADCFLIGRGMDHELTHVLGFNHMHTRPDRDTYLDIHWENINSNFCNDFEMCRGCNTDVPLDFDSIMMYSSTAFACKPGEKTILKKSGDSIKYNMDLSEGDIMLIKELYGCN